MEATIERTFDDVCRKKKVSIEELQSWLLGEIDTRVQKQVSDAEQRGEERWKVFGFEKNRDAQTLRKEMATLREQLAFIT